MENEVFIHESALVDEGAVVGPGTKVWHFSHVMSGARIGSGCSLGQNVFVADTVRIGNNVKIQNNVSVYAGVELEDDVFCGPSVVFTNVRTPRSAFPRSQAQYLQTVIKRGASVGANATVVCGLTVGEWALIGAGAVVTADVPPFALMVGVPARRIGWVCKCGERLQAFENGVTKSACPACSRKYQLEQGAGMASLTSEEGL